MNSPARIAVIGTGWWATATHIPALRDHPSVEIAGLCDVSEERVRAAATAYGVKRIYTDHRELLATERPDAVVVATTHASHASIATNCLEAGAHVLIEKPMTLLAADARRLTERAAQLGRTILIGYPWNYRAHALRAREEIASGRLGPIQIVQSVFNSYCADLIGGRDRSGRDGYPVHGPGDVYSRKEHSGGGHGHLQITHAAGLLFFVTGLRVSKVQARMATCGSPLDLVDVMHVEFEGGALGTVSGTSNSFLMESRLSIGCAAGSIQLDVTNGAAAIRRADSDTENLPPAPEPDLARAPINNLIGVALGAEEPGFSNEIGWRAVELLDAAYRSAEEDGRVVAVGELYGG